ncbi:hypothetical protein MVEN_00858200 [Mycena venus]|uniref:Uncharacterized protein n=1 Tax=Mycena venus TaxID=2733690 RepID=A0A8H6YGY0_9AGAR|nr:hypothetical protein MVEN_00858200 [Mycena venus]
MTHSESRESLSLEREPGTERRITRSRSSSEVGTKSPVRSPDASPTLPSGAPSPYLASASSPHIPSSSPHLSSTSPSPSASREEEDEEPITFAPTGLRAAESEDFDEEGKADAEAWCARILTPPRTPKRPRT